MLLGQGPSTVSCPKFTKRLVSEGYRPVTRWNMPTMT